MNYGSGNKAEKKQKACWQLKGLRPIKSFENMQYFYFTGSRKLFIYPSILHFPFCLAK
jgi:hypothetical protein